MFNSLRKKLTVHILLAALLPLLFMAVITSLISYYVHKDNINKTESEIAARVIGEINLVMANLDNILGTIPNNVNFKSIPISKIRDYLELARKEDVGVQTDVMDELAFLDHQGMELSRVHRRLAILESDLRDRSSSPEFLETVKRKKRYVGSVTIEKSSKTPYLYYSVPVMKLESGDLTGVLTARIRFGRMLEYVVRPALDGEGTIYVLNSDGVVMAHTDPAVVGRQISPDLSTSGDIVQGVNGKSVIRTFRQFMLGDFRMYVAVEVPIASAFSPLYSILTLTLVLLHMCLVAGVVYGTVEVKKIIRPIESLVSTAREIKSGNYAIRAIKMGNDEIGLLADTFNTMASQLIEKIDSINNEKVRSEAIIAGIGDPLSILDTNFRVMYQNPIHRELVGEHVGEFCYRTYEHREQVCEVCPMAMAFADGKLHKTERTCLTNRGLIYVDITASPIMDAAGRIIAGIEISRNITKRKLAEKNLAAEKERLAVTLASIGDAVIATDTSGVVVLMNKVAENLTGWSQQEAIGMHHSQILYIINEKNRERYGNPMDKIIKTGLLTGLADHRVLISRDGSERVIADSGAPIKGENNEIMGTVFVFRDITERRKMEEDLLNARKLESVAILSAGIAHEINNPLTNASLRIQIMKQRLEEKRPDANFLEKLEAIEMNVDRASTIAKELLDFSRQRELEFIPVNINFTLSSAILSLEHKLVNIKVNQDFEKLPEILGDPVKLEQVFIILLNNAIDSMSCGGNIDIATSCSDDFVKLRISDTGCGIPEQHLARVFDPFFTTKEVGAGTGLGLSICYGIITQHKGIIDISSSETTGTIVTVKLPVESTYG